MRIPRPLLVLALVVGATPLPQVARSQAPAATPHEAGAATSVVPAPARGRHAHRLVYTCRGQEVVTYADRPCGEFTQARSLDVYTPADAGRPPTTVAEPARVATRPATHEREARLLQETAEKCERLQKALDEVDDRMRAGYPARQAAHLWQRWREARSAVRDAGC